MELIVILLIILAILILFGIVLFFFSIDSDITLWFTDLFGRNAGKFSLFQVCKMIYSNRSTQWQSNLDYGCNFWDRGISCLETFQSGRKANFIRTE